MNLTVMRRIRFCAGHRLFRHGGKCEFFHGHNYVADFHIVGAAIDAVGRVVDFADLKRVLKGWIDDHWDHAFLLNIEDENGVAAIKSVVPTKYYILPYNPTAENLARYLLEEICPTLLADMNVRATKVVVWETDEACCAADTFEEATATASARHNAGLMSGDD
jgi:6-pyruvoyltetrahydropterin/6-carboxytetrahydropterin synthase